MNIVIGGFGEVTIEVKYGQLGGGYFLVRGRGGQVALHEEAIKAIVAAARCYALEPSPEMVAAIAKKIDCQLKAR